MEFKFDEAKTWLEDENGKQVAVLDHPEVRPGVVNLVHTEVDPSLGGQGIAGKITQAVADSLRDKGLKAELSCSYSIKWFAKHPEYADVLADPEMEKQKAEMLAGPACGLRAIADLWGSLSTPVDKLPQRSRSKPIEKENRHEKTIYCYKSIGP